MSIRVIRDKCTGCGSCVDICPGGLIKMQNDGKVKMEYPKDCWGCAACMKECTQGAIAYYLAEDLGGKGGYLTVKDHTDTMDFIYVKGDQVKKFTVQRKKTNRY